MINKQKGFTLIELLVVIAIIGILSSVVLASLNTARNKGADAAVKEDLNNARGQAENFYDSNTNSYSGVCAAAGNANPAGINDILKGAGTAAGVGAPVVTAATAGVYNKVTCHDSAGAWAAEAPLKASVSGTPAMWCVDSTGKSTTESTNLAGSGANQYACQ